MNDPHVESLHYSVISDGYYDYSKAKPILVEENDFTLSMDLNQATFKMKSHYSTKEEAIIVADKFLRRWEVLIGLEQEPGCLKFIFQKADVIDLSPSKASTNVLSVAGSFYAHSAMEATLTASKELPSPPHRNFAISPDVETLYERYKSYKKGRENLLSMAYMCLTVFEVSAGSRKKAAKQYSISQSVLNMLGTLCAERGSSEEARKTPKRGNFNPLSTKEKEWIVNVIKAIIKRAGEYAYDSNASLPKLTMDDFSAL